MRQKPWLRLALVLFTALILVYWLYTLRRILTPFFLGIMLAYILNPLVDFFERKGAPRVVGILIVYLSFGLTIGLLLVFWVPTLIDQLEAVSNTLPEQLTRAQSLATDLYGRYARVRLPPAVRQSLDQMADAGEDMLRQSVAVAIGSILGLLYELPSLLLAPVLAFYFARDWRCIGRRVLSWVPAKGRDEFVTLMGEIDAIVGGFIRGQLVVASIVGLLLGIGLYALRIQFAWLIGLVAGFLDLIPYLGPVLGLIPALLFALLREPVVALYVVFLFVAVNQVESSLIGPYIVSDYVELHPLVVVFSLLVGGVTMGFVGMVLAVPTAAVLRVIARYVWPRLIA